MQLWYMEAQLHELPKEGGAALSVSIEPDNSALLPAHKVYSQSYRTNHSSRPDSTNPFRCLKPNTAEISSEMQHRSQYHALLYRAQV